MAHRWKLTDKKLSISGMQCNAVELFLQIERAQLTVRTCTLHSKGDLILRNCIIKEKLKSVIFVGGRDWLQQNVSIE